MEDILFNQIISLENLFSAWREFRRGKRGRRDVQEFERYLEDNVFELHACLANGHYHHGPYHRFHIFDPKHRIIHKATVRDRLVHHAIYRILYPLFDRSFIFDSYSCRIGKGTYAAVDRLEIFARRVSQNYLRSCWALKFDIRKFFDSVDHGILLQILENRLSLRQAQGVIDLLREIVSSYSKHPVGGGSLFEIKQPTGLPIGNLTSQLFANVYLDAFDHFIKDKLRLKYYLRYTDDAVILDADHKKLSLLIPIVEHWLWYERRLTLHPNKVEIRKLTQGIDFLGYVTLPHYRVLRTKTKRRMLKRVNRTNIYSYVGLLKHCHGHHLEILLKQKSPALARDFCCPGRCL